MSNISFYRTELRVMQATYDNEKFLTTVAEIIEKLTSEVEEFRNRAYDTESEVRRLSDN